LHIQRWWEVAYIINAPQPHLVGDLIANNQIVLIGKSANLAIKAPRIHHHASMSCYATHDAPKEK